MQEHQRQQILQAMGVAVLQPRFVFAGAKDSKVLEALAPVKKAELNTPLQETEAKPSGAPSTEEKFDGPLKSLKDIVAFGHEQKDDSKKSTAKTPSLRYRHRIVACGSIIFVVDQPELEWQQGDAKLRFMQDIYQALFAKPCEALKQDTFAWPITGIDDSHAKATEQAFIEGLAKQYQAKCVVLFAKTLAPLLMDENTVNGLPAIAVEPIEHYWQNPLAKAELWQSLQSLR